MCLTFVSLARHERLKAGSPLLAQELTIFGLIWVVPVIVVGALSIKDLSTLRARELPRLLHYLGVVTGVAGILSILALNDLTAVYGVGLIVWFVLLGIIMLRGSPVLAAANLAVES